MGAAVALRAEVPPISQFNKCVRGAQGTLVRPQWCDGERGTHAHVKATIVQW